MDWLKGMNKVVSHIETNLTEAIVYEDLARIVGCSTYEFSRIFSFMAGISLSEYIRRRRLSQAVFDIQKGDDKIIDIALKYCYESPQTFTRAFKELHGVAPTEARKGAKLKNYPPISFMLTIRGVNEMTFKIEKKEAFGIIGAMSFATIDDGNAIASMSSAKIGEPEFAGNIKAIKFSDESDELPVEIQGFDLTTLNLGSNKFKFGIVPLSDENDDTSLNRNSFFSAFYFKQVDGKVRTVSGVLTTDIEKAEKNAFEIIPASTWAIFSFDTVQNTENVSEAYSRILTEWFPNSQYKRDENVPHIESYPLDSNLKNKTWEIWMPIVEK